MRGRETKSLGEKRKEEVVGKSDVGRLVSRLVGHGYNKTRPLAAYIAGLVPTTFYSDVRPASK